MDADDAVDILEELDEEDQEEIIKLLDEEIVEDINLIQSYDEEEIGSKMTTNYIRIPYGSNVKEAMKFLIEEAAENDNVSTIFVVKDDDLSRYTNVLWFIWLKKMCVQVVLENDM